MSRPDQLTILETEIQGLEKMFENSRVRIHLYFAMFTYTQNLELRDCVYISIRLVLFLFVNKHHINIFLAVAKRIF